MVASPPYRWMWDIDKDVYFRVKDITSFSISKTINSENKNKFYVKCYLTDVNVVTIHDFLEKHDAINYIENFVKEPI